MSEKNSRDSAECFGADRDVLRRLADLIIDRRRRGPVASRPSAAASPSPRKAPGRTAAHDGGPRGSGPSGRRVRAAVTDYDFTP